MLIVDFECVTFVEQFGTVRHASTIWSHYYRKL